jgi:BirA family biotin operon repressor/biotin-[acetyl-CoA-carboxylase] ligase
VYPFRIDEEDVSLVEFISDWMSGEEIAKKFGISRNSVWKRIKKLRELGFEIDSRKKLGYKIRRIPEFNPVSCFKILRKFSIFKTLYYYPETDSTNLRAKNFEPNTIVVAEKQTSGRGRLGRRWFSEKGGLYFSMVLQPNISFDDIPKVTLTAGVSVAEALGKYSARIKWPNDVLIGGKKVCGILSELSGELERFSIIVGIGINVENQIPEELEGIAISLREIDKGVRRIDVFSRVVEKFADYYGLLVDGKWEKIRERWIDLSDTLGKDVEVKVGEVVYKGKAVDMDIDGGLVVESDGKRKKIFSGDCFYVS